LNKILTMDQKNKEKIKNIVSRSYKSLPVGPDLPRLGKQIRIFHNTNLIYPPVNLIENGVVTWGVAEGLFGLISELSKIMIGDSQEKIVNESFPQYFRMFMKKDEINNNSNTKKQEKKDSGFDKLEDKRLKEALIYLSNEAFTSSSSTATFLFNLDKPDSRVCIFISPEGVKVQEGEPKSAVDCTVTCSTAILTAILTGSLEASIAMSGGHLIVDNMPKLMVFSQAFKLEKKAFDQFKSQSLSAGLEDIQQQQQDNAAIGATLNKYFGEILGEENKVVKVLKACNSATISPAIIELKFALGVGYMTKDVPGSWKFEIAFTPDSLYIRTQKSEQDLKNNFCYTWELELSYNPVTIDCQDVNLRVLNLYIKDQCPDSIKDQLMKTLGNYGTPTISIFEKFVFSQIDATSFAQKRF
jgi:putative sterol carrier protein